jgi:hypothetical protein
MDLQNYHKAQISLYDIAGREIHSFKPRTINDYQYKVDLTGHPAGVYFVKIQVDNQVLAKSFVLVN